MSGGQAHVGARVEMSKLNGDEAAFSFNASGWLYVFQIGVVAMLQEVTELGDVQVHGTSAGAAAAAAMALEFPGQLAAEEMCQQESRSRLDFKAMVPLMKEGLERLTPLDAADRVNGRLGVVCTELRSFCPLRFETVEFRQYACRKDVVELLSATAHVPVLGGYSPHVYKGRRLYDGLFTDTHPLSDDKKCFKVSWTPQCDCGCTEDPQSNPRLFAPRVRMPLRWCVLPPDDATLRLIFWHGYCEARAVLSRPDFPRHVLPFKPGALEASEGAKGAKLCEYKGDGDGNASPLHKRANGDGSGATTLATMEALMALSKAPIFSASAADKRRAVALGDDICDELQRRVDAAESKWQGAVGCARWCAVALRLFFPCCPLASCVQPLVLGGR